MAITGIQVGSSGKFTAAPNGALQAGDVPVWSVADANVTIVPAADGFSASVAVSVAETATFFSLIVTGVNSGGTVISSTVTVPVLPAPPVPATGFDIQQV